MKDISIYVIKFIIETKQINTILANFWDAKERRKI